MFRAYRPPPRNASRDMVNSIAPVAGGILGGAAGAYFGGPQGAMMGYQVGSGLGQSVAGLTQGGDDMEQRVASGQALAARGLGQYLAGRKQYGAPQVGEAKSGTDVTNKLSAASAMPEAVRYEKDMPGSPADEMAMQEQAWRYKGLPLMAKTAF